MDRSQHKRYLVYLKKYEYFGRGRPRLDAQGFAQAEAHLAALAETAPGDPSRRELLALLLRD